MATVCEDCPSNLGERLRQLATNARWLREEVEASLARSERKLRTPCPEVSCREMPIAGHRGEVVAQPAYVSIDELSSIPDKLRNHVLTSLDAETALYRAHDVGGLQFLLRREKLRRQAEEFMREHVQPLETVFECEALLTNPQDYQRRCTLDLKAVTTWPLWRISSFRLHSRVKDAKARTQRRCPFQFAFFPDDDAGQELQIAIQSPSRVSDAAARDSPDRCDSFSPLSLSSSPAEESICQIEDSSCHGVTNAHQRFPAWPFSPSSCSLLDVHATRHWLALSCVRPTKRIKRVQQAMQLMASRAVKRQAAAGAFVRFGEASASSLTDAASGKACGDALCDRGQRWMSNARNGGA